MRGLTPLIRLLAAEFVKQYDIDYEAALDRLYSSQTFLKLQDPQTTFSTWAPFDLLEHYKEYQ